MLWKGFPGCVTNIYCTYIMYRDEAKCFVFWHFSKTFLQMLWFNFLRNMTTKKLKISLRFYKSNYWEFFLRKNTFCSTSSSYPVERRLIRRKKKKQTWEIFPQLLVPSWFPIPIFWALLKCLSHCPFKFRCNIF